MSRRARVLGPATALEIVDWSCGVRASDASVAVAAAARQQAAPAPLPATAAPMPGAVGTPVGTVAAPPGGTAATDDGAMLAEHQARLAALEREAFTKGYAQGERAGLEAGGKRAEAMLRRVAQTLEELGGLRQSLVHETERQLHHLALERLGTTAPATIRLNPEDYTIVAQDAARWGGAPVTVIPDPSIPRGGCLVESEFGSVDATVERQFDELSRALFGEH